MRIGSLCSGYGGLEMGVRELFHDATVEWHAESDPVVSRVLAWNHPDIPNHGDITAIDWRRVDPVDILAAGWPCQPFSPAGAKLGAADHRGIWPYVSKAIRVLRPPIVVLENVRNVVRFGELERVIGDLADQGYDASWTCVRASDVGATHTRQRMFIYAANSDGQIALRNAIGRYGPASRSGRGSTWVEPRRFPVDPLWGAYTDTIERWAAILGRPAPDPVIKLDGVLMTSPHFAEWMMGLPFGHVTNVGTLSRRQQLKALGNGVVPRQAAYGIAAAIVDGPWNLNRIPLHRRIGQFYE